MYEIYRRGVTPRVSQMKGHDYDVTESREYYGDATTTQEGMPRPYTNTHMKPRRTLLAPTRAPAHELATKHELANHTNTSNYPYGTRNTPQNTQPSTSHYSYGHTKETSTETRTRVISSNTPALPASIQTSLMDKTLALPAKTPAPASPSSLPTSLPAASPSPLSPSARRGWRAREKEVVEEAIPSRNSQKSASINLTVVMGLEESTYATFGETCSCGGFSKMSLGFCMSCFCQGCFLAVRGRGGLSTRVHRERELSTRVDYCADF